MGRELLLSASYHAAVKASHNGQLLGQKPASRPHIFTNKKPVVGRVKETEREARPNMSNSSVHAAAVSLKRCRSARFV